MKCPSCKDATLSITERQGVEIDYCPECRGVWLDRGELDKLIERSERSLGEEPRRGAGDFDSRGRQRSRKSLLRELFD